MPDLPSSAAVQLPPWDLAQLAPRCLRRLRSLRGETALHEAACGDSPEMVSVLAAANADLNAAEPHKRRGPWEKAQQSCGGDTPLHIAAEEGRAAAAQLLLAANAPLDVTNDRGRDLGWVRGLAGSCACRAVEA
eukprot:Skav202708  [mRNA]  locus=scaffold654:484401:486112:+ [translate_table: standard]